MRYLISWRKFTDIKKNHAASKFRVEDRDVLLALRWGHHVHYKDDKFLPDKVISNSRGQSTSYTELEASDPIYILHKLSPVVDVCNWSFGCCNSSVVPS
jgi:hypothetical protein